MKYFKARVPIERPVKHRKNTTQVEKILLHF